MLNSPGITILKSYLLGFGPSYCLNGLNLLAYFCTQQQVFNLCMPQIHTSMQVIEKKVQELHICNRESLKFNANLGHILNSICTRNCNCNCNCICSTIVTMIIIIILIRILIIILTLVL